MTEADRAAVLVLALLAAGCGGAPPELPEATPRHLPRWRGFNLQNMYDLDGEDDDRPRPFERGEFAWIAGWGFNFVRLPLDYRIFTDPADRSRLVGAKMAELDRAVALGKRYGIHVCLNFHRAPGYCVNEDDEDSKEPFDLWTDEAAQALCARLWGAIARRYRGVPNRRLSFNLVNEPDSDERTYARVVRRLTEAIRTEDPGRLIIADGLDLCRTPVWSLTPLGVAQSLRAYAPYELSCWKAEWWPGAERWPAPAWPMTIRGERWDRAALKRRLIAPWKALEAAGVGVHAGEGGSYRFTPHAVALAWTRDWLELLQEAGWGWAMWNLAGPIGGPLDSMRTDIAYESWRGRRLDRALLELLRAH